MFFFNMVIWYQVFLFNHNSQSVGAAEYTDCNSAKRKDSPNECAGDSVTWGCRINRLHFCQEERLPKRVSWWPSRLRLQNKATASLQRDKIEPTSVLVAQSALGGATEYTNCLFAGRKDSPNKCPGGSVGWDCRTHQLHFCRGVRLP